MASGARASTHGAGEGTGEPDFQDWPRRETEWPAIAVPTHHVFYLFLPLARLTLYFQPGLFTLPQNRPSDSAK